MAASASNPTTKQFPIWITSQPGRHRLSSYKIHSDDARLKHHLIRKLSYKEDDANRVVKQRTKLLNNTRGLGYFWKKATNERTRSAEVTRAILQSIEHSQLIYMLKYQADVEKYTALHWCAHNKRRNVIQMILDCCVGEEECYQLLSITGWLTGTPLSMSCKVGDTESVRVMLNHINQDMLYSLLQIGDMFSDTPLHYASREGNVDIMKEIHESVTQTQWINLVQMKGYGKKTVLQTAANSNKQSSIETIRESVSDEEWIQLLSTPLPEFNKRHHYEVQYQRAVSVIDELRAEARTASRVKSSLLITDQSG